MTLNPKIGVVVIFGSKRVNYNEMDGDRPRLSANRNCYRLWRLSWALAQISCLFYATLLVQGGPKNVPLCLCPCLCHLLTDFQNSFTGTLCRQFAIMWLLYMPPHRKCVSALPCEVSMKYAYITVVTSKHFSRIEKKHFRPTLQRMVYMTLDWHSLLSYRPFTAMLVWIFSNFTKMFVCYYRYVCIFYLYFTR